MKILTFFVLTPWNREVFCPYPLGLRFTHSELLNLWYLLRDLTRYFNKKKWEKMRHPGIEPGPPRWQRGIIATRLMALSPDGFEPST